MLNGFRVIFIYTFYSSLSSTSSFLEQGFQSIYHLQMTLQKISTTFPHHFKICLLQFYTSKPMQLLHSSLLLYCNEINIYQFNCHLNYVFEYRLICFQRKKSILDQNVNELEFELSRMQMKRPNNLIDDTEQTKTQLLLRVMNIQCICDHRGAIHLG